jgi:hypothetical protein
MLVPVLQPCDRTNACYQPLVNRHLESLQHDELTCVTRNEELPSCQVRGSQIISDYRGGSLIDISLSWGCLKAFHYVQCHPHFVILGSAFDLSYPIEPV